MDQKTCEGKGWDWNETAQTCTRPKIGRVSISLPRGGQCGGSSRKRKIENAERSLPLSVRNFLLKASKKASRAGRKNP